MTTQMYGGPGIIQILGAGPPIDGYWLSGQEVIDATGNLWRCIATGSPGLWVAAQPGYTLGVGETTSPYTMTTVLTVPPGCIVTKTPPPGQDIEIEAVCPWILEGSSQTFVNLTLLEDGNVLKQEVHTIAAALSTDMRISTIYTPLVPGPHTWSLQAALGATSSGALIEAGVVGGLIVTPYLRVKVA